MELVSSLAKFAFLVAGIFFLIGSALVANVLWRFSLSKPRVLLVIGGYITVAVILFTYGLVVISRLP